MSREEYVATLKSAAVQIGTKAVMASLVAEAPIFANPILGGIAEAIAEHYMNEIVNFAEFGAFFLYIDVRTDQQGQDFFDAAARNVKAKLNGTPEEKALAEKDMLDKFHAFARWSS